MQLLILIIINVMQENELFPLMPSSISLVSHLQHFPALLGVSCNILSSPYKFKYTFNNVSCTFVYLENLYSIFSFIFFHQFHLLFLLTRYYSVICLLGKKENLQEQPYRLVVGTQFTPLKQLLIIHHANDTDSHMIQLHQKACYCSYIT